MTERLYFIVDLRREWTGNPYITLWGPNCGGYAYPLPWAGRYTAAEIESRGDYLTCRRYLDGKGFVGVWDRFGVACDEIERHATAPDLVGQGRIDGNAGPVVRNSAAMRAYLRRVRYVLASPADAEVAA